MNSPIIQSELFLDIGALRSQQKTTLKIPHPIPYQGSKRKLAPLIMPFVLGEPVGRFYEPFGGSGAMTLAAASANVARSYQISDSLSPLVDLWKMILLSPNVLADRYEDIWQANQGHEELHYYEVRRNFNSDGDPAKLLYLLARCVKNAVRFNSSGEFNQSHDKRRLGTRPDRMRHEIERASAVLSIGTVALACDFRDAIQSAQAEDFVYMDPPWEGTSGAKDTRYHQLLNKSHLVEQMEMLIKKGVRFLLSFDGRLGEKTYGDGIPAELGLTRIELNAGRSSQATLAGRDEVTFESLYLSPALVKSVSSTGRLALLEGRSLEYDE